MRPKDADGMANSVDPGQTDLCLHCLLRPVCPNIWTFYGNYRKCFKNGTVIFYNAKCAQKMQMEWQKCRPWSD